MIQIRCTDKLDLVVISKLSQLLTKMNINPVKYSIIVSYKFFKS